MGVGVDVRLGVVVGVHHSSANLRTFCQVIELFLSLSPRILADRHAALVRCLAQDARRSLEGLHSATG